MIVALVIAALVIAYACASLYIRKASAYLQGSADVWDRMYLAAKKVISDPEMPDSVAAFAAAAILCSGCGCLTRSFLLDSVKQLFGKRSSKAEEASLVMTDEQRANFSDVVVNAIYYDSLHAPLSGFLLRRFFTPWLKMASEKRNSARSSTVRQMVTASRNAIEHKAEGKRLLAHA
ncbi:hypothetical protein EOE18_13730 [Novosphingobium umbonatum]|uniref:Uncharacterized protein n=1 Tax=Novosphingobium umbonatum TaxID=1908524 RepID=A0A3S2VRN3_9SPHN|nr:hypothetical protein [Novosphingobium umbonatum]RVU03914.1 hypothetical protein EOE18_13730 [Novosphingobium umbonatum]